MVSYDLLWYEELAVSIEKYAILVVYASNVY